MAIGAAGPLPNAGCTTTGRKLFRCGCDRGPRWQVRYGPRIITIRDCLNWQRVQCKRPRHQHRDQRTANETRDNDRPGQQPAERPAQYSGSPSRITHDSPLWITFSFWVIRGFWWPHDSRPGSGEPGHHNLMEPGGIEPPSRNGQPDASTRVSDDLRSVRARPRQARFVPRTRYFSSPLPDSPSGDQPIVFCPAQSWANQTGHAT